VIHHTDIGDRKFEQIDETLWRKLFDGITGWLTAQDPNYLSAHFHIGRFGECAMLADPEYLVTFHAGVSSIYHPITRKVENNCNEFMIGIELLGDGNKGEYSDQQYITLAKLCAALMRRYPQIDPRCITGHENIAPTRKVDPGKLFKWKNFFSDLYKEWSPVQLP
jgi:N-acetyl-anhydromuramyl-L-alanine amidase AmpD